MLAGLVIVLISAKGIQAARTASTAARRTANIAVGGVIGFTAVVVHSFVDFGLHIPAVSLFTAIVAARLANLADIAEPAPVATFRGRFRVPAMAGGKASGNSGALLAIAVLFVRFGRTQEQAERFRLASLTAPEDRRVACSGRRSPTR